MEARAPGSRVNPVSERAADYLLETGRITPDQLEEARRTQGFFGGDLISHLLKLGFADERTLGEALTEVSGVPYASGERLRVVSVEALAAVPGHLAERHRAVPFRLEERRLRVAMLNPRDRLAVNEIQAASGHTVEPWITTEYRLYQALERHYGIRLPGVRAIALAPPEAPPRRSALRTARDPRPRPEPAAAPEVGLDGLPLDADVVPDFAFGAHGGASTEGGSAPAGEVAPSAPRPARAPGAPDDPLAVLERALVAAESRESVASALVAFGAHRARRAALFAVGKDGLKGVEARGRGVGPEGLRAVTLAPLGGTVFETALAKEFYFGPVSPLPAHRELFERLWGKPPHMVLLVPIRVKDRVAALLYLDDEDEPMLRPDLPLMRRVAAKAGLALEILLLKKKLLEQ